MAIYVSEKNLALLLPGFNPGFLLFFQVRSLLYVRQKEVPQLPQWYRIPHVQKHRFNSVRGRTANSRLSHGGHLHHGYFISSFRNPTAGQCRIFLHQKKSYTLLIRPDHFFAPFEYQRNVGYAQESQAERERGIMCENQTEIPEKLWNRSMRLGAAQKTETKCCAIEQI